MKRIVLAAILVGVALFGGNSTAFAASERASCPGIGFSEHARAGEMRETAHFVVDNAEAFGLKNPGAFFSLFAHLHEGTHAACEAALGG